MLLSAASTHLPFQSMSIGHALLRLMSIDLTQTVTPLNGVHISSCCTLARQSSIIVVIIHGGFQHMLLLSLAPVALLERFWSSW